MIIDATDLIVGRFATVVAKRALLGDKVDIINCEKAIVTGKKDFLLSEFKRKYDQGTHVKGPFVSRMPDRLVRRMIRGMLPYKQERGEKAYKRVMCYISIPPEFAGKEITKIDGANISKVKNLDYLSIQEVCKHLGAKYKV